MNNIVSKKNLAAALFLLFVLFACSRVVEKVSIAPLDDDGWIPKGSYYEKTVHYGTTRIDKLADQNKQVDIDHPDNLARLNSGNEETQKQIKYGRVQVIIPYDKRIGGTEGMSVSKLIHDIGWDDFSSRIKSDDLVVFVHGYATTFTNAAIRAAQLAHDTNFQGEAVLFSWPSEGSVGQYFEDKQRATENFELLAEFLTRLSNNTTGEVHVVAHSMGTYILVNAMAIIGKREEISSIKIDSLRRRRKGHLFGQIILAAPDINTDTYFDTFASYDLKSMADRITLYSTHNDAVLKTSILVNIVAEGSSQVRLGDSSKFFSVIAGMDTIDARQDIPLQFFGHSFYANYRSLVSDIYLVLNYGIDPDKRMLQKVADNRGQELWFIRD